MYSMKAIEQFMKENKIDIDNTSHKNKNIGKHIDKNGKVPTIAEIEER